jgi:hypothetical protein
VELIAGFPEIEQAGAREGQCRRSELNGNGEEVDE